MPSHVYIVRKICTYLIHMYISYTNDTSLAFDPLCLYLLQSKAMAYVLCPVYKFHAQCNMYSNTDIQCIIARSRLAIQICVKIGIFLNMSFIGACTSTCIFLQLEENNITKKIIRTYMLTQHSIDFISKESI